MENKSMELQSQSIYSKIKNFFYKLFHKNIDNKTSDKQKFECSDNRKGDFLNNIKAEVDFTEVTEKIKMEQFAEKIEKDDTILEELSLDKLKALEKFYEDTVKSKREILKKLQNSNI